MRARGRGRQEPHPRMRVRAHHDADHREAGGRRSIPCGKLRGIVVKVCGSAKSQATGAIARKGAQTVRLVRRAPATRTNSAATEGEASPHDGLPARNIRGDLVH